MSLTIAESLVQKGLAGAALRPIGAPARPTRDLDGPVGVPLHRPAAAGPLTSLLERRSSSRDLSGAIGFDDLSDLLAPLTSARADATGPYAFATTGGLSAFRLLCVANAVSGLDPGAYWLDPRHRSLVPAGTSTAAIRAIREKTSLFLGRPASDAPALIVLCIAHWTRLGDVYDGATLASSYWDAGALIAHLYLSCTEAGLRGCACSAIDDGSLVRDTGLDPGEWGHVGSFAAGRAAVGRAAAST